MKNLFIVGICGVLISACQTTNTAKTVINPKTGEAESVWAASIVRDEQGKVIKRFIPVELFTGADWDGKHILTLDTPVNKKRGRGEIVTPYINYRGVPVIKRERYERGRIYQEFEINGERDGLEMTYQNRRGVKSVTHSITKNKFPLGSWRPGESRAYCDMRRNTQLTIIDLDYGDQHGIKFHWKIDCDEECESTYIFKPYSSIAIADIRKHPEIELAEIEKNCSN